RIAGHVGNDRPCGLVIFFEIRTLRRVIEIRTQRREIIRPEVVGDGRRAALDELAPLFFPKEEGAVLLLVIDMRNPQRTADVATWSVELEDWARLPGAFQEVVISVVGCVAVELVEASVILPLARLEHHDNGAAGTDAVVRSVVRAQGLELANGILRRQIHETSAASTIVLLGTIDQVDVMGHALAIEAEGVRRGKGIDTAE